MSRQKILMGLGFAVALAGVAIFARFWVISGTETPPNSSGMLSVLDWGSFFVSPLLVLGGVAVAVWATLANRHTPAAWPHPASAPPEDQRTHQWLETTH